MDSIEFNFNLEPDLIKLNNEGNAYIANMLENGISHTMISSAKILQDANMNLNLQDQFFYLHTADQNKLNDPKFPEFIIANGTF